jgi:hypothetical protein
MKAARKLAVSHRGARIIQGSRRGVITTSYFIAYYYFILMKRFCERQKDLRAVHLSGAIGAPPPGWMDGCGFNEKMMDADSR